MTRLILTTSAALWLALAFLAPGDLLLVLGIGVAIGLGVIGWVTGWSDRPEDRRMQ
jgi:hypothetical protein